MTGLLRHPVTLAWAMLVIATLVVFTLAESAPRGQAVVVGIVLIAAFKVRLVFLHFMELESGAMPWRAVAEGWVTLVATILLAGYLLAA